MISPRALVAAGLSTGFILSGAVPASAAPADADSVAAALEKAFTQAAGSSSTVDPETVKADIDNFEKNAALIRDGLKQLGLDSANENTVQSGAFDLATLLDKLSTDDALPAVESLTFSVGEVKGNSADVQITLGLKGDKVITHTIPSVDAKVAQGLVDVVNTILHSDGADSATIDAKALSQALSTVDSWRDLATASATKNKDVHAEVAHRANTTMAGDDSDNKDVSALTVKLDDKGKPEAIHAASTRAADGKDTDSTKATTAKITSQEDLDKALGMVSDKLASLVGEDGTTKDADADDVVAILKSLGLIMQQAHAGAKDADAEGLEGVPDVSGEGSKDPVGSLDDETKAVFDQLEAGKKADLSKLTDEQLVALGLALAAEDGDTNSDKTDDADSSATATTTATATDSATASPTTTTTDSATSSAKPTTNSSSSTSSPTTTASDEPADDDEADETGVPDVSDDDSDGGASTDTDGEIVGAGTDTDTDSEGELDDSEKIEQFVNRVMDESNKLNDDNKSPATTSGGSTHRSGGSTGATGSTGSTGSSTSSGSAATTSAQPVATQVEDTSTENAPEAQDPEQLAVTGSNSKAVMTMLATLGVLAIVSGAAVIYRMRKQD